MKKALIFFSLFIIIFSACEKDDFCLQNPVTPQLIITFYDDVHKDSLKTVERLTVWVEGKDSIASYTSIDKDSIAIPLNSLTNKTTYLLKKNVVDGNIADNQIATFTIEYTPKEEYVSRSCGYKIIFNDILFSSDSSWIKDFTPDTLTTINHQNASHVQIFH